MYNEIKPHKNQPRICRLTGQNQSNKVWQNQINKMSKSVSQDVGQYLNNIN